VCVCVKYVYTTYKRRTQNVQEIRRVLDGLRLYYRYYCLRDEQCGSSAGCVCVGKTIRSGRTGNTYVEEPHCFKLCGRDYDCCSSWTVYTRCCRRKGWGRFSVAYVFLYIVIRFLVCFRRRPIKITSRITVRNEQLVFFKSITGLIVFCFLDKLLNWLKITSMPCPRPLRIRVRTFEQYRSRFSENDNNRTNKYASRRRTSLDPTGPFKNVL